MNNRRDKNGHLKSGIRLPGWDYCQPWIYMITLTVKERRPILGKIVDGKMIPSQLGEKVAEAWRNISSLFPEVEPCECVVMPEHFHGIIWVHKRLESPIGEIIRSFKIACTKANAALEKPALFDESPTFWFPGLYDTILFSKGQLKRMSAYIHNNVERRWAVMQNPELFKVTRSIALPNDKRCDAVGNHFLLDATDKMLIQVSRRASESEIAAIIEKAILHGERGGVTISGCISPGEQAVAKAVREASLPLIAIIPRGFGPYFKPSGDYFTACANGKLLMISPFKPITKTERLTRERCFAINALAAEICGDDPQAIRYRGIKPEDLARLVSPGAPSAPIL
jgi:REP element-mobilizing transposase RayT